jgi:hypothetical protein
LTEFVNVLFVHDFDFLLLFWPSLACRFDESFLAVHSGTAENSARGYAENAENLGNHGLPRMAPIRTATSKTTNQHQFTRIKKPGTI